MSKAILVLEEMPCACAECPLHTHVSFDYYYDESICMATGNEILDTKEVHRMCPLKEMPYNYEDAFKIACELLNGAFIGGVSKDDIFERMMDKDGFVSNESYEKFILENLDRLAWWRWEDENEAD